MTGALPSEQETTFAETYDCLARAWSSHEALRFAGAPIPELNQSSMDLNRARDAMWDWWRENRIQEVR